MKQAILCCLGVLLLANVLLVGWFAFLWLCFGEPRPTVREMFPKFVFVNGMLAVTLPFSYGFIRYVERVMALEG
ncbi:hypothetical protein LCGC14_0734210 [marine sediment metagenome]|uniref:Uncharacterized protein n=1 Tax=marine sediment metagenome TaxID=412755 RepID=A0A0F9QCU9_9ZZZZ